MLSRTHGQAATPTTVGKEMANVVVRLRTQLACVRDTPIRGKIAGAVGAYQAHMVACPDADWPAFAKKFVESLGLVFNACATSPARSKLRRARTRMGRGHAPPHVPSASHACDFHPTRSPTRAPFRVFPLCVCFFSRFTGT